MLGPFSFRDVGGTRSPEHRSKQNKSVDGQKKMLTLPGRKYVVNLPVLLALVVWTLFTNQFPTHYFHVI